jgi:hypothetical protein
MERLDFTLLTDGSSDAILIRPLAWLLEQNFGLAVNGTWADLRHLRRPPKGLRDRIEAALDLYPCDILFVHRDAERESLEQRTAEVRDALLGVGTVSVPVVPVRMQEAWLLIDEHALRMAAGNPHGKVAIELPGVERLESIPDPKQFLHDLLRDASEHTGRRRQRFNPGKQALRLGDLIADYSPLRRLNAFRQLDSSIQDALRELSGAAG